MLSASLSCYWRELSCPAQPRLALRRPSRIAVAQSCPGVRAGGVYANTCECDLYLFLFFFYRISEGTPNADTLELPAARGYVIPAL